MQNKFLKAKREIVDNNIYLNKQINKKPTQRFVQTLNIIKSKLNKKIKFCDVGCATGGFIDYVKKKFPNNEFFGIEKSIPLIKKCKRNFPYVKLMMLDIEKKVNFKIKFDCITMIGILMNFDDPKKSIRNCLKMLNKNGTLVIYSPFNEFPIDTITRSKRSSNDYWELGWNIHSKSTIEKILKSLKVKKFKWKDFLVNFNLKKKKDPLRVWTVSVNGKKTLFNGASQYVDGKFLIITK